MLAEDICEAWGWLGIRSAHIVAVNKFGNVIFIDADGQYWRICPEELQCKVIADGSAQYERLMNDEEFQLDWSMARLVQLAEADHGPQPEHRCFCLKIPGILGGGYEPANIGTITVRELIRCSGDLAQQIKDLPPGSQVKLKIMD